MRILFSTDGSQISLTALKNMRHFADKAIVDIICVIDWTFLPTSMNIEEESYTKTYETLADSVLDFAESVIKETDFELGKKIKSVGAPVDGILEQTSKENYDMIVMGSHGKKGLQKWLGSVSREVVSNISLPTFISKRAITNNKVLFAVDGSQHSYNAVSEAARLLNLKDKELYMISVKENPELLPLEAALDRNWIENIEKQQKIHATKTINKAKSILTTAGLKVNNEVILTGNTAQKIIEYALKEEISLIIMGARSKVNLSTLLLGSVSKRVLENTGSSVLIIRK